MLAYAGCDEDNIFMVKGAETPTVLVDMDGVLADFDNEVLARIAARHPHIAIVHERPNFYVAHDYPAHADLVRSISDEPGFFDALPVAAGALDGWQRLLDLGYHPRICSSPISTNPTSATEKRGWLARHFVPAFGAYVVQEAIITRDKHLYDGIALIDDRPEFLNADIAPWQHVVFDKTYNQGGDKLRIYGWDDVHLGDVLAHAQERYRPVGQQALRGID